MIQITVRARVTDGRLTAPMPQEWPEGEYEIVVQRNETSEELAARRRRLLAALQRISDGHRDPNRKHRTKEEIDAQIEELRNDWERDCSMQRPE